MLHKNYLIFILLTNDSIVYSFNNLCMLYELDYQVAFYNKSYYDRYIYYILLILIKPLVHLLLYTYDDEYIKFIFLLSLTPVVFEWIINTNIILFIKKFIYKCAKKMKYDIVKHIIKHICLLVLKHDPHLTSKEIAFLMNKKHQENMYVFIKSFIVLVVVQTAANGNSYMLRLIKTIYNNNNDNKYKNPYPKIQSDVEKLKIIVNKRQWEEFCNPYVIQMMGNIYKARENTNAYEAFFKMLEVSFVKVFIGVTIAKVFYVENYVLLGVIDCFISRTIHPFVVVGCIAGYITNNYYVTFIVCEYGSLLTPLLWWCWNNVTIKKQLPLLYHMQEYNYYILVNLLMCYHCMFALLNARYPLITAWFMIFGYLSNYSLFHMVILGFMLYLGINIYFIKDKPKDKIVIIPIHNYKTVVHEKIVQKPIVILDNYNVKIDNTPNNKIIEQKIDQTSTNLVLAEQLEQQIGQQLNQLLEQKVLEEKIDQTSTNLVLEQQLTQQTEPPKIVKPILPLKNIIILKTLYNPSYTTTPI